MRRFLVTLAGLALVAGTGCPADDIVVGCTPEQEARKECVGEFGERSSSPTPSPSVTPTRTRTTPPPPSTVKPPPGYPGRPVEFVIRSSANGYEPREKVVYVGDILVFENLDPNQKHTFTGNKDEWDSGTMAAGDEPYRFKVNLAPGDYHFHCELVPYVLGGPIRVQNPPKT